MSSLLMTDFKPNKLVDNKIVYIIIGILEQYVLDDVYDTISAVAFTFGEITVNISRQHAT